MGWLTAVIPNPWRILAVLVLLLAGIAFGYVEGLAREADRRDAQQAIGGQAAQVLANRESTRREAIGAQRETSREQIRVVYRTIKEKADEYEQKNRTGNVVAGALVPVASCALDADGLRIWNAANAGDASALSGEPDYRLLDSALRSLGRAGRPAAEPHRLDGAVRAVSRSAQEAGAVREPTPIPTFPLKGEGANEKSEKP
jgi:hypothetical protein